MRSWNLSLLVSLSLSICLSMAVPCQAQPGGAGGIGEKVGRFRSLLAQRQRQGADVSDAEALDRQSRAAAQQGKHAEAMRLLEQAIARLEKQGVAGTGGAPAGVLAPPVPSGAQEIEVVFAANLESQEGCHREDSRGADLFRCVFDLKTGTARDLKRLTEYRGSAEWFPSLSSDGKLVAYNVSTLQRRGHMENRIEIIDADSGASRASIDEARFPCFSSDGAKIAYSIQQRGGSQVCVAAISRQSGVVTLGAPTQIMDRRFQNDRAEDPSFFPDGKRLAFHRKGKQGGAGAAVIGIDGAKDTSVSEMNGAGHVAVNPDGRTIIWSRSQTGGLEIVQENGRGWSKAACLPVPTAPAAFAPFDQRLGACASVAHTYLAWVSSDLLLVSSQAADAGRRFSASRVFLLKFTSWDSPPEIIDLSGAIERLAGKSTRDFCTADGRIRR